VRFEPPAAISSNANGARARGKFTASHAETRAASMPRTSSTTATSALPRSRGRRSIRDAPRDSELCQDARRARRSPHDDRDRLDREPRDAARLGLTLRIAALLTLASIALFASSGVGEQAVRAWVRAIARASIALFLMAFVARPLRQLWWSGVSSWLLANRRYLGVAAAYAQLLHGIAIVWLLTSFVKYQPDLTGLVGGGLGFAVYFAMALTSSEAAVAALGERAWKRLHTAGAYGVWFIFALTNWGNIPFAFEKLGLGHQILYVAIQAALLGALGLRAAAWQRQRKNARAVATVRRALSAP
jgi:hypothetical protein